MSLPHIAEIAPFPGKRDLFGTFILLPTPSSASCTMLARVANPVTFTSEEGGLRVLHEIAMCGSCLAAPADQGASVGVCVSRTWRRPCRCFCTCKCKRVPPCPSGLLTSLCRPHSSRLGCVISDCHCMWGDGGTGAAARRRSRCQQGCQVLQGEGERC